MAYSRNQGSKSTGGTSSMAVTAVAFQDHLVKNLSLSTFLSPTTRSQNRSLPKKKVTAKARARVDTGLGATKSTSKVHVIHATERVENKQEFVLNPKNPRRPDLAEKLGLVDRVGAELPLSEQEWLEAKTRSNRRQDSEMPCVICKEDFGAQQQVLLSCTHVFHRACLEAFERFTGKKTCPVCRKEEYQTRIIYEGEKHFVVKSAIRIQTAWRGHVVRCWYRKLRQTVPPKDPKLRKKFYEEKLHSITERLLNSYDNRVDDFLVEIDAAVAESRRVMERATAAAGQPAPAPYPLQPVTQQDWQRIQLKAVERGNTDCPICIMPLEDASRQQRRQSVLLSCTHTFHHTCLATFEELSINQHKICPVCRSRYQKCIL